MKSSKMMLILCTFFLAYSLPVNTKAIDNSSQKNGSSLQKFEGGLQLSSLLANDRDSNSASVVVLFIYKDPKNKLEIENAGMEHEKYILNPTFKEAYTVDQGNNVMAKMSEFNEKKQNKYEHTDGNAKRKSNSLETKEIVISSGHTESTIKTYQTFPLEEVSSIAGSWPKYFYDIFHQIPPFPEAVNDKVTHKKSKSLQNDVKTMAQRQIRKKNQPQETAGPILYPSTIYNTEFDIPFFS